MRSFAETGLFDLKLGLLTLADT